MSIKRRGILALLASLTLLACGGEGTEEQKQDQGQDLVHGYDVVRGLGINKNLGPRNNPDGEPVPAGYQPLTREKTTLAPLSELYVAGLKLDGHYQGLLNDLKHGDLMPLYRDSDDSWTNLPLRAARGDVDGDGFDEVVVLLHRPSTKQLVLKVIDRQATEYRTRSYIVASGVSPLYPLSSYDPFASLLSTFMDLKLVDLDQDGRDEVVAAVNNRLWVFDDSRGRFAELASTSFKHGAQELSRIRLGAGDFLGDGRQRLLVLHNVQQRLGMLPLDASATAVSATSVEYRLYDGALQAVRASGALQERGDSWRAANLAVGDVDGDGLDDVVLNARDGNQQQQLLLWNDLRNTAYPRPLGQTLQGEEVALLDADGDGVKEIVAGDLLLDYSKVSGKLTKLGTLPSVLTRAHTAGDLDGDLREDLVAYYHDELHIWGLDAEGVLRETKTVAAPATCFMPALVAPNVDQDSVIVRYTGKHELRFTTPQIIAVMAAPPTYTGIGQNVDNSSTTFGKKVGGETEATASIGLSASLSIGAKAGFKLFGNGAEVETKTTFAASMNWTALAFASYETSYAFSSGPEEDKVVFTSVPFDVYYYEVISSPNPAEVGQIISINLPREPQTLSVTREFYNAHNGDAPDVDASVLGHTVGDPWSYPTRADRDDILGAGLIKLGWLNPTTVTVGQGSGTQTLTIDATAGLGAGVEAELSVEKEAEVTAGPVVAGASYGFSVGVGLSVKAYEGLFIEGVIGDIPAEHYTADRLYRAGLFAYPHRNSDKDQFMVINYWVEK